MVRQAVFAGKQQEYLVYVPCICYLNHTVCLFMELSHAMISWIDFEWLKGQLLYKFAYAHLWEERIFTVGCVQDESSIRVIIILENFCVWN